MPFVPGVVFERETGKLYRVADGHVTVLFPWPELRAFRRPMAAAAWRACDPPFVLPFEPPLEPGDALDQYCSAIPREVRDIVRPFAPHHWRMLAWIARSGPGALDVAVGNPALAFMVASAADFEDGARRSSGLPAPVLLPYRKQREILGWLGFPATESARRLVRKITHQALAVDTLRALRARLRNLDVAHRLAHAPRINATLLRMTADGTLTCTSPRLIARIAVAPDLQPLVQPETLADTVRMWRTLHPAAPRPSFDTASRLATVHDELADAITRAGGSLAGPHPDVTPEFEAPFPGTATIVPLTSVAMLRHEGRVQRNCVASYAARLRGGRYAIYRVLAPERCTLGLIRQRGQWSIDQLKGLANAPVAFETMAAVRSWLYRCGKQEQVGPATPAGSIADAARPLHPAGRRENTTMPLLWGDDGGTVDLV